MQQLNIIESHGSNIMSFSDLKTHRDNFEIKDGKYEIIFLARKKDQERYTHRNYIIFRTDSLNLLLGVKSIYYLKYQRLDRITNFINNDNEGNQFYQLLQNYNE